MKNIDLFHFSNITYNLILIANKPYNWFKNRIELISFTHNYLIHYTSEKRLCKFSQTENEKTKIFFFKLKYNYSCSFKIDAK